MLIWWSVLETRKADKRRISGIKHFQTDNKLIFWCLVVKSHRNTPIISKVYASHEWMNKFLDYMNLNTKLNKHRRFKPRWLKLQNSKDQDKVIRAPKWDIKIIYWIIKTGNKFQLQNWTESRIPSQLSFEDRWSWPGGHSAAIQILVCLGMR